MKKTREELIAYCNTFSEEILLLSEKYDDAFVGIVGRAENPKVAALYNINRLTELLMEETGMTKEGVLAYINREYLNNYCGEYTPFFIHL